MSERSVEPSDKAEVSSPDFSSDADAPTAGAEARHEVSGLDFAAAMPKDYRIIREVQRGGQAVILEAEQRATGRRVAIKVLKDGPFSGPLDQARFRREVHILAQLRHPNIVTIHEMGQSGGFHFFVMDFIEGQPLVDYVQEKKLSVRDGLELFVKVCDAINAAHLRGIIHRDVKPSNIIVDANGEPFVLDFGLAKHSAEGEESQFLTITGLFLGSLPWAAPEQVDADPEMIDLRTDVYAMGVILYQMLTNQMPYDTTGPRSRTQEVIRYGEPEAPSKHRPDIDEDVDTIVLRCLHKDRLRRYQSAGDLKRDIERYLSGEPIEARRDSMAYVLRKKLVRYRMQAAVITAFAVVLAVGLVVSISMWRDAEEARTQEAFHRKQMEIQRDRAVVAETEAERRQAEAESLITLLQEMISTADPNQMLGADFTVRQMLDMFVPRIEELAAGQPAVEAKLRVMVAEAYASRYEDQVALEQSSLALKAMEHASLHGSDKAQALEGHAVYLMRTGSFEAALPYLRQAVQTIEQLNPVDIVLLVRAQIRLAACLASLKRFDEAQAVLDNSERLADTDESVRLKLELHRYHHVGYAFAMQEMPEEAVESFEAALRVAKQSHGDKHPIVGALLARVAMQQYQMRHYAESADFYAQALVRTEPYHGEAAPLSLLYRARLADAQWRAGKSVEAAHNFTRYLRLCAEHGIEPPTYEKKLTFELAKHLVQTLQCDLGAEFAERYWRYIEYREPLDKSEHVTAAELRAMAWAQSGRADQAVRFLEEHLVKVDEGDAGPLGDAMTRLENALGYCLAWLGHDDDAERMLVETTERFLKKHDRAVWSDYALVARTAWFYRRRGNELRAAEWESRLNR